MAHIFGFERSQLFLLPETVDDYVAIDHAGKNIWWDALRVHHGPFKRDALILPIFGVVDEYRAVSVVLLYALSIVVRNRPASGDVFKRAILTTCEF